MTLRDFTSAIGTRGEPGRRQKIQEKTIKQKIGKVEKLKLLGTCIEFNGKTTGYTCKGESIVNYTGHGLILNLQQKTIHQNLEKMDRLPPIYKTGPGE